MNEQMILWMAIAGTALLIFVLREGLRKNVTAGSHRNGHAFFEMGKEDEMFYIPGDQRLKEEEEDTDL